MQKFMQDAGGQPGPHTNKEGPPGGRPMAASPKMGRPAAGSPQQILESNPLIAAAMAQLQSPILKQVRLIHQ